MNYASLAKPLRGLAAVCFLFALIRAQNTCAQTEVSSQQLPKFSCGAIGPSSPIVFDPQAITSIFNSAAATAEVRLVLTGGNCSRFADDINALDFKTGKGSTLFFKIEARAQSIQESASLGFKVYSPDGSLTSANILNLSLSSDWASPSVFWNNGGGVLDLADVDGILPDSWSVSGMAMPGNGFIAADYVEVASFDLKLPNASGVLCIDSAFVAPAAIWMMTPDGPPDWFAGTGDANVGGTRTNALCMTLFQIPCLGPQFTVTVDSLSTSYCAPVNYQVEAIDADGDDSISYSATHDGAGDAFVDAAGNVTYTPSAADTNMLVTVDVFAREPATCGDGTKTSTKIAVTYDPPHVTCTADFIMVAGNTVTTLPPTLIDSDACENHTWSLFYASPSPVGQVLVDSATGAVTYYSDPSDHFTLEQLEIAISATDGIESAQCAFSITFLAPAACCDLAGDANNDDKVNISDVTFLIARIFGGGPAPDCCGEGSPNGDSRVNIADITFLIARIFAGGSPPGCGPIGVECGL